MSKSSNQTFWYERHNKKPQSYKRLGFFATRDLTFSNYLGGEYLQSSLAHNLTAYSQVVHFILKNKVINE